ncbi:MAG: hypothetical protein JOZ72_07270 [Alphaproteobacteria bacterium]|nr:hypothetical protein [Alphaproteobacteria bacterium]
MSANPDRLYELVPAIYRLRDADQGYLLKALLRVATEQYGVLEDDIAKLYENWFIETCEDWVVPYIGGLIGYERLSGPVSRREVAETIALRRRKGTLAAVEEVARAVSGWPVKAVEFYRRMAVNQNINALHMDRGRTAELRDMDALGELYGPFDEMARNVDVRRLSSSRMRGAGNIPALGLFAWRLKSYTVTGTPAYCYEAQAPNCYEFNPLGSDTPLFNNPLSDTHGAAPDLALPVPIRRRLFEERDVGDPQGKTVSGVPYYYGDTRSLTIRTGAGRDPVPAEQIVAADLGDWSYRPLPDTVAVDPERGRLMFPPGPSRRQQVWVSYSYGFSADMGGGEYARTLRQAAGAVVYRVGGADDDIEFKKIGDALARWSAEAPAEAVIEIADSGVYTEQLEIALKQGQSLQLRAASGARPIIHMLDWRTSAPDSLSVTGEGDCWFVLDGIVISGRGVQIEGDVLGVALRHCTLVPGWGLGCNCEPVRPTEASLTLVGAPRCLTIEHSIVGAIQVDRNQARQEPLQLRIADSILDATGNDAVALGTSGKLCAQVVLVIRRSTVFGQVQVHALELGEDTIFMGEVLACRRQQGCLRFCYVPPGSRTPRRFECQPDMVEKAVGDLYAASRIDAVEREVLLERERLRVEPQFDAIRYGKPVYCRLALACATEISRGAHDESEMGVFHDLFQPQRIADLRTRLREFTPAGADAGIIFES